MIAEIGGDLSRHRPDICRSISASLISRITGTLRGTTCLWGMLLMYSALDAETQRRVTDAVQELAENQPIPNDTFDASCLCRLWWLKADPYILRFYLEASGGHESALASWEPWNQDSYFRWCISRTQEALRSGRVEVNSAPADKSEAWLTVSSLIRHFRHQVELERGWELLWDSNGQHRNEKAVQVSFWNIASSLCKQLGRTIYREPETGRGPVDFEFANGYRARVLVEFKLADHKRLLDGLDHQLIEYLRASESDSAFFVCVGFDSSDQQKYETLKKRLEEVLTREDNVFVQLEYVDASKRKGASTMR